MNEIICKICNDAISSRKFKSHLEEHNITEQNYYDTYNGKHYCPICNNETNFVNVFKGYTKYCSRACLNKSSAHTNSVKQTKLNRYGNPFYTNPDKIKESHAKRSIKEKQKSIDKMRQTRLEKYGDEHYNNIEKHKQTCLAKYGVDCAFKAESVKKKISDIYNSKSESEKQNIYKKRQQTFENKTEEEKRIIGQKHRDAYNNKTELEKLQIKQKRYLTHKKNHSFKTSKSELECYNALLCIYPNAKHNYKSEKYPFVCDLYIPEIDTYIELNFHWTHGKHKYNKKKDKLTLDIWLEKAKTSNYFKNAIHVWTIRDINKFKIAKKNKLNYFAFYTRSEFDSWLSQLQ